MRTDALVGMSNHRLRVVGIALCLMLGMTACAGALRQEPLRVGGNISPPEKTKNVDPRYPPEARAEGVTGVVVLEILIDPDGRVTDVKILRSVPELDDAAIEAVRQWEYRPTLLNGIAVPLISTVTMNFLAQ